MDRDTIRRDLFAVQVLEDADVGKGRESWTVIGIARSLAGAKGLARGVPVHRNFPCVPPRVEHPSQKVVSVFCLSGNEITE